MRRGSDVTAVRAGEVASDSMESSAVCMVRVAWSSSTRASMAAWFWWLMRTVRKSFTANAPTPTNAANAERPPMTRTRWLVCNTHARSRAQRRERG